jgi:hypothetical protein
VDEHRLGLKPILGKLWAPKGQRPIISVYPRYEWLYLYGFVQPQSGRTVWYLLPALNKAAFAVVLDTFATTVAASATKRVLVVMDNAPWHNSDTPPQGVDIIYQPAYSPELQPAEHLWQLSDETLKNRTFDRLEQLEHTLTQQCIKLMADPERVKAHTLFHWWPKVD